MKIKRYIQNGKSKKKQQQNAKNEKSTHTNTNKIYNND